MTFISSTEPAKMFGATAVFCDITPDTYCLSPAGLERQIQAVLTEEADPKAAVAVDILGNPCDYDAIRAICEKYGLFLIEDAAQSFGASYHGKKACAFGHIATTSFFPAKPLGAMVTAALSLRMTTRWISCAGLCASTARAPAASTTMCG